MNEHAAAVAAIVCMTLLAVLFAGTPDIADAIMAAIRGGAS